MEIATLAVAATGLAVSCVYVALAIYMPMRIQRKLNGWVVASIDEGVRKQDERLRKWISSEQARNTPEPVRDEYDLSEDESAILREEFRKLVQEDANHNQAAEIPPSMWPYPEGRYER